MERGAGRGPAETLDRHQRRRDAGLPTITVLVGPLGLAVETARRWAEGQARPVALVDEPGLAAMVDAWVDRLALGRDLTRDAAAWLARRLGRPADELAPWISRKTPLELAAFLDSALPDQPGAGAEAACRWLLERSAAGERPGAPGLSSRLGAALAGIEHDGRPEHLAAALHDLAPPGSAPVLLAARRVADPAWVESASANLARLAEAQPRLSLILAIEPAALDAYQRQAPESRARAIVRAGVVQVPSLDGPEIGRRLGTDLPDAPTTLAASIRRLAADGASDALVGLFADAARAADPARTTPDADDRARSAAERFLCDRLASLPETAGLFELNARLDIPFGPIRSMEVDLVCRPLRLAVEIDGYHHFRDADAYRRDRRKDQALQEQGYMVVRVLADDVVRRLEETLDQILAAVASRRGRADSQRGMNL